MDEWNASVAQAMWVLEQEERGHIAEAFYNWSKQTGAEKNAAGKRPLRMHSVRGWQKDDLTQIEQGIHFAADALADLSSY